MSLRVFFVILYFFPLVMLAQTKKVEVSLTPDALSAKAIFEDILVRRYSQGLSTQLTKETYSVSSQLDIKLIDFGDTRAQEPITDLMLGFLDPNKLSEKFAGKGNAKDLLGSFLSQYTIERVNMTVGLNPGVSEGKKKAVNEWLAGRLKSEFGNIAKGQVEYIENIFEPTEKIEEKKFFDKLKEFQDLVGKIVLAIAMILAALFLGFFAWRASKGRSPMGADAPQVSIKTGDSADEQRSLILSKEKDEQEMRRQQYEKTVAKIKEVVPRLGPNLEALIVNWCNQGDSGIFRLVCFTEAISADLGQLPIPVDSVAEVKKTFRQMPHAQLSEKIEALDKAYWDVVATINIGADSLSEPFSYLSQSSVEVIDKVLMDKNSKMKALVAFYMPEKLRAEYIEGLDENQKKELLEAAGDLQQISLKEFNSIDDQVAFQLKSATGDNSDSIHLDLPLNAILSAFPLLDQVRQLRHAKSREISNFKKETPHIAFIDEWPEQPLRRLLGKISSDEVVSYLRVVTEAQEHILAHCPPMTAKMTKDELLRPSDLNDNDIEKLLRKMSGTLVALHESGDINLQNIFGSSKEKGSAAA